MQRRGDGAILGGWRRRAQWPRAEQWGLVRHRGQVLVVVAFGMVALLGMTGVAIDLGFGFAHRRQVANAAEAAALAGAKALAHHVAYRELTDPGIGMDPTMIDQLLGSPPGARAVDLYADSGDIWQEVETAAAATVPPFTDLGAEQTAAPAWPARTGNALHAWYVAPGSNAPNGTAAAPIDGTTGAPPASAIGVRVEARLRYSTFFSRVLGPCCDHVDTFASARAVLKPLAGNGPGEGAPYVLCGGFGQYGAWVVATPGPAPTPASSPPPTPPTPVVRPILVPAATPAAVDPTVVAGQWTLGVHSPSLGQPGQGLAGTDCGAGSNFDGLGDPQAPCIPPSNLPCTARQPGSATGPLPNMIDGLNGCGSISAGCVVLVPIAATSTGCGQASCPLTVVTYACGLITGVGANVNGRTADTAILLAACTVGGQAGPGVIDPSAPGAFTYKLVLDCDDPAACSP